MFADALCRLLFVKLDIDDSYDDSDDLATIELNTKRLFQCYFKRYRPPEWVLKTFAKSARYKEHAQRTVYYFDGDTAGSTDVKLVLAKREPVNIAMQRYYYPGKLLEGFGTEPWTSGYSTVFYRDSPAGRLPPTLPPNIAVYCFTPVLHYDGKVYSRHVINSVGLSFDDSAQPDYMFFAFMLKHNNFDRIRDVLIGAYRLVARCARDLGLRSIAICRLGAEASFLFPDAPGVSAERNYLAQIWLPAVSTVVEEFKDSIDTSYLSGGMFDWKNHRDIADLRNAVSRSAVVVLESPSIPHAFTFRAGMEHVLFQNAWGPHSVAGNGNEEDPSLDGWVGRVSAISTLCFPPTNPYIEYRSIGDPGTVKLFPEERRGDFEKAGRQFITVHVMRHAESEHNAFADHTMPYSVLTEEGRSQCERLAMKTVDLCKRIDLVLSSSLTRCLSTTLLAFPGLVAASRVIPDRMAAVLDTSETIRVYVRYLALDCLREKLGWGSSLRRPVAQLKRLGFARFDFSMCDGADQDDDPYADVRDETDGQMAGRARTFFARLSIIKNPLPKEVLVCSHAEYLYQMFNFTGPSVVDYGHCENAEEEAARKTWEAGLRKQWGNCEVRTFLVAF